jgi:hypothetical protein
VSTALGRVAAQLKPELDKYGIEVKGDARAIIYDNKVRVLDPYTDARKCEKILKEYIKHGKAKAEAIQQSKQGRLL